MHIYATVIIKEEEVINLQKSREGHMKEVDRGEKRKWYKYSTHIGNSQKETYLI